MFFRRRGERISDTFQREGFESTLMTGNLNLSKGCYGVIVYNT